MSSIENDTWYSLRQIAENQWLFGIPSKEDVRLALKKYGVIPKGKYKGRLIPIYIGKFPNSPVRIKGEGLKTFISLVQKVWSQ